MQLLQVQVIVITSLKATQMTSSQFFEAYIRRKDCVKLYKKNMCQEWVHKTAVFLENKDYQTLSKEFQPDPKNWFTVGPPS